MYYLGIDLGGTGIKCGVLNDKYQIIAKSEAKTHVPCSFEEMTSQLAECANSALIKSNITIHDVPYIGIGTPGSVNKKDGVLSFSGNLHLEKYPMRNQLAKAMNCEVRIENDANAAAFGEFKCGALKGYNDAIAITLGTGIGSGIIINKKIYSGCNGGGGEIGHMVIDLNGKPCTCGRKGCWEAYASATGLINITKEFMLKDISHTSDTWQIVDNNINLVNGRTAFDAMRAGDKIGKQIVETYIFYLGEGITNCINIFQPDILCIGGGISHEGENLLKPLREYVNKRVFKTYSEKQTILTTAKLSNDAGIIGAALLEN